MDVRAVASLGPFSRVGFVIPKFKHSGVDRNRLKRRLRELVRVELLPTLKPSDVVLRVTPAAYTRDFESLQFEMRQLVRSLANLVLPSVTPPAIGRTGTSSGDTPPPTVA